MSQIKVLLVDDEVTFKEVLKERLEKKGFEVLTAGSGAEALEMIEKKEFEVAILDIALPDTNGIELLQQFKKHMPELEILMLTGHGSIESAIEAIKIGAYDYLTKPCKLAELEITIQKAAEKRNLLKRVAGFEAMVNREVRNTVLIGKSAAMASVRQTIKKVGNSEATVLILGESGTGKDLVAKALHYNSAFKARPFQVLNSAALSPQLLESELFGHTKGAFTGASSSKLGLVEVADGGTLFLDEIGDMDINVQSKFLRFLETGEFRRLGENKLRSVKVRVIAATNKDLAQEVKMGRFREDLYYRLNVVTIYLQPLRERREDIPLLVDYFLKSKSDRRKIITPQAMDNLQTYSYPGNVRELANIIERGILLSGESQYIEVQHLFLEHLGGCEEKNNEETLKTLQEVEREHIQKVMVQVGYNKTNAAKVLGIGLRTLYRKLEEYKM
ncbi:MAG: sigma-54 dependent transcriptional regulator [Bacillota bacterium]